MKSDRERLLQLTAALAVSLLLLTAPSARAYNHAHLEWQTLETEHFLVHFHQGAEESARRAAAIVEEIYPAITGLYNYEPKAPTHLIIRDTDDFSNGAAFFYDDKFEIWATALEFNLRGTHNWLRDVLTHEFTHMVSIQAAHRFPHRMPAFYLQAFGYEQEKRQDVLIGYPNVIASYPIAGTQVSAWWAEGVAQYQTAAVYNDWWDTHRDMLLRSAILDGTLLSYDAMGNLNKNGLEAEMVYNQGNSLVRYIAAEYGEATLFEITQGLSKVFQLSESKAFETATGKSGQELYDDWRAHLEQKYAAVAASVDENPIDGSAVSDGGYLNLYPRFQPGSKALYWASNRGHDYGNLSLVRAGVPVAGAGTGASEESDGGAGATEIETLAGALNTPITFSSDGSRGFYSKRNKRNEHGSRVNDVYVLDMETEKEERLTHNLRAKDPCPSPDGTRIAAILNGDGTNELVVLDAEGKIIERLTESSPHGTQYYQPVWSADGKQLLYTMFAGVSRDIVLRDMETGDTRFLARTPADERDAVFVPGDNAIVFASDRTGIFNIFRLDLDTETITQVTNVKGAAMYPTVAEDGTLAFAGFRGGGYEICTLDADEWGDLPGPGHAAIEPRGDYRLASAGEAALDLARGTAFSGESRPYEEAFPTTQIMPRLLVDNGKPRIGAYLASREVLERQSLFAGANVGRRFDGYEFELFALYENRMLPVTIFGEAFRVRRRDEQLSAGKIVGDGVPHQGELRPINLELRYDLVELDAGLRWEWGSQYNINARKNLSLYYVRQDYNINLFATDALDGSGYGKDGWNYYVGDALHARYDYRAVHRAVDSDINPRGRQIMARYARNWARLNPQGNRTTDTFDPLFENNNFNEYEADWTEWIGLPWGRHTLQLRGRGALIDNVNIDDFFHFPVGSTPGLRGYTFYVRQGRKLAVASATYRFPLWAQIDRRLAWLYMHRLYGGVFFEAGNAWQSSGFTGLRGGDLLKDAGFELRLEMTSSYIFPSAMYVEGAYGFDEVSISAPDTPLDGFVVGGNEWRWYFGLLFGF